MMETSTPQLQSVPLDAVDIRSNPRKRVGPLDELVQSIQQHGVLTPIRVRSQGERFELIFGQRRLLAARKAGLTHIPAVVAQVGDEQLLEEQLIENGQREDIHPMEEAEAFSALQKRGMGLEEICARVAKKKSHVLFRLKLIDLTPSARKAFFADRLSAQTAYLLARVPNPELQDKALQEILAPHGGQPWTAREVADHLQRRYMLLLSEAPFDKKDAALVPEAGDCGACPKRTGNAPDLFGDVARKDVCTDPGCFAKKVSAAWTRIAEKALERGDEVLSEEACAELFPHGTRVDPKAPFVDLNDLCVRDPKHRTWAQLLGKARVPRVLAKDRYEKVHTLVRREDADSALEALGHRFPTRAGWRHADTDLRAAAAAEKERVAQRGEVTRAAISRIAEAAEQRTPDAEFWRLLVTGLCEGSWHDVITQVVRRRGLSEKNIKPEEVLRKHVEALETPALQGLALELVVGRGSFWAHASDYGAMVKRACALYGVDLKKLDAELGAAKEQARAA
jgi:ParB/RepB/Spo0J family partition protein